MKVCRAYHYTPDQAYELDFLLFSIAIKDLGEVPQIDRSFFWSFCSGESKKLSISERRAGMKAKVRRKR
jgi:hypothetical protein